MFKNLPDEQRTETSVQYLQGILEQTTTREEAQHLLDHIAGIIRNETSGKVGDCDGMVNIGVLNLAFRNYYALVERFVLQDRHFEFLPEQLKDEPAFLMLHAILLTNHWKLLNAEQLRTKCLEAMAKAIHEKCTSLLAIVKALNLLCRKYPLLDLDIPLEHIYFLLQCQVIGMREETLTLFSFCVKERTCALKHFAVVNEFWPWTNKNKFYLLSCMLSMHSLEHLIQPSAMGSTEDFFSGLRLSLNYKRLFASSQYLVKALSGQESEELLQLSVNILTHGSRKEITNFYSQWFSRISQKDALFALLQEQLEIAEALQRSSMLAEDTQRYRLILIFSMFSRQVFQLSKLHFFKISTELITNCFSLDADAQLLIFKFVVDNLGNFAIEDCLEFLLCFIKTHKCVDTAQYRNNILGRLPTIINYISKTFNRLDENDTSTLKSSIKSFFMALQQIVDEDIQSKLYQPKIFALKLLDILVKSLYAQLLIKNAKNCIVTQNQRLGRFLIEEGKVFDADQMQAQLIALLHDPQGFDDAHDLLVSLLKQINYKDSEEAFELCKQIVQHCELDECSLSTLYAVVAIDSFTAAAQMPTATQKLFDYCFEALNAQLTAFNADPLYVCRNKSHLFGYLQVVNVCVTAETKALQPHFEPTLVLIDKIVNDVLKMLNFSILNEVNKTPSDTLKAASFQDMEESLKLLVQQSALQLDNNEDQRKFLLMTFWLTLKSCCDLATNIGCHLVLSSETDSEHFRLLRQCLQVNIAVLTKCRHKGAIEAAGLTIGKLTNCLTAQLPTNAKAYQLLHDCLELLFFENGQQISTTRRGAGLSIMFLHIVKNEVKRSRPLLKRAIRKILASIQVAARRLSLTHTNVDCLESLMLHYLCVLVKDTELREPISKYHDDIMMAAIKQIDNPEWTICNAALQLFGALVPKIVGQKQATEFVEPVNWESTEVTYMEITLRLPQTCYYILNYCKKKDSSASVRSIILFVGFLAKVEHLRKDLQHTEKHELLNRFRELMWSLLSHRVEKVRKLAATCFVRAHEFRCDLPLAVLEISKVLFRVKDDNLFQGLVFVIIEGIQKIRHESLYTVDTFSRNRFLNDLQCNLGKNFQIQTRNLYTLCKLLDLLMLLGFNQQSELVHQLINIENSPKCIGSHIWCEKVAEIK